MDSGKRTKSENKILSDLRPWADLPNELLEIITSSNLVVADYLSFRRVCRNWGLFCSEMKQKFMTSQSPFVLYISTKSGKCCCFYQITDSTRYKTKLPKLRLDFFVGVSSGYFIMIEPSTLHFRLINPITGHQLRFSPMPEACDVPHCAILASIGSRRDNLLVTLNRKSNQLSVYRDKQWQMHSSLGNRGCVEDVVVFYGRLFVVTSLWQIGEFNLRSGNSEFSTLKYEPHYLTRKIRLVASKEQLFAVNLTATEFNVYRIDFLRSEWVKVENLGEEALFIDNMSCRLSNTSKWGGRSNCVYYLSFNSSTCSVYSLNGEILETIQIGNGFVPAPISSWYFLDHLYSIDNVRDDDQFGFSLSV